MTANALSLNNLEVEISAAMLDFITVGNAAQDAMNGYSLLGEDARVRRFSIRSRPELLADAEALRRLVMGLGSSWDFKNPDIDEALYSSRGARSTSKSGTVLSTTTSKYGSRAISLATGAIVDWANIGINSSLKWSAMAWINTTETGGYRHFAELSDGTTYEAGVLDASPTLTNMFIVDAAMFSLKVPVGTSDDPVEFDDLVVFPYHITAAMVAAFEAANTAFSSLPFLIARGNLLRGETIRVQPVAHEVSLGMTDAGSNILAEVGFPLIETYGF